MSVTIIEEYPTVWGYEYHIIVNGEKMPVDFPSKPLKTILDAVFLAIENRPLPAAAPTMIEVKPLVKGETCPYCSQVKATATALKEAS